ncbi:MAG: hypothetical protein AB7K24_12430, partial [Gemmataceae bacterium]
MNTQTSASRADSPWTLWSWKNMLALTIAVVGLGGIVFMSQWIAGGSQKAKTDKPPERQSWLAFKQPVLAEETIAEMYPKVDWHDFWFANPNKETVDVALLRASCKCQSVEVLVLTPEEVKQLGNPARAATAWLSGVAGLPQAFTHLAAVKDSTRVVDDEKRWKKIEEGKETVSVAPGHSGMVRMTWSPRVSGPIALKIAIANKVGDEPGMPVTLEAPLRVVSPVLLSKPEIDVGVLEANGMKTQRVVCFSATHNQFDLDVKQVVDKPYYSARVEPLSAKQCEEFQARSQFMLENGEVVGTPGDLKIPVRCGYLITVAVKERVPDGQQLDIGPFHHRLLLNSEELIEPINLDIYGSVLGDIRLVANERQRINLGDFPARQGASRTEILESDVPGLKLALESALPDKLKVDLQETGEPNR